MVAGDFARVDFPLCSSLQMSREKCGSKMPTEGLTLNADMQRLTRYFRHFGHCYPRGWHLGTLSAPTWHLYEFMRKKSFGGHKNLPLRGVMPLPSLPQRTML